MIRLEANVTHTSGDFRLEAEFSLDEGVTALFGPSGAGKTTLLRCLAGLERPEAGRVTIGGRVRFDAAAGIDEPPERRRIGFVFQDHRLFPHLDVETNLHYGRRLAPSGRRRVDAARVIELLELGSHLKKDPASLSGGEAQRVALGRALLCGPEVLFLDEPLTGLDEARKGAALDLIARVRSELDVPILLVSHSLADILELTTRIVVLDEGRVVGAGEITDVLGQEAPFRLADRLGLESILEVRISRRDPEAGITFGTIAGNTISLPPVDWPDGSRALVAVRPEDVILARAPVEGTSAQNAFVGVVTDVRRLSDRVLVSLDVGGTIRAEITARSAKDLGVALGVRLHCLVKTFSFRWRRRVG